MVDLENLGRVWIVMDSNYDGFWPVAVYPKKALAKEHERLMGGCIEEQDIRGVLHPDATDPAKQEQRAKETEAAKRQVEEYILAVEQKARLAKEARPNPPHMKLCCCETFTSRAASELIAWTDHGYCSYCGGWSPSVFRKHMGENALHAKIDGLAIHDREKMRQIVAR